MKVITPPPSGRMLPTSLWLLYLLLCIVAPVVRAQLSFDMAGTNTVCYTAPDAMTGALHKMTGGLNVPQHCVKVPTTAAKNTVDQQMDRCYYLFVPECASGPVPIVMNMHGADSCPIWSTFYDRWAETAMRHCFALMYPSGVLDANVTDYPCFTVPGGRNVAGLFETNDCCCTRNGTNIPVSDTQDPAVLRSMLDDVVFENRIEAASSSSSNNGTTASADLTRIYMAGHANGCAMALGMGAFFHDVVAAVACHSAGNVVTKPRHYNPVPTWLAQGMKDDKIWYQFAKETYRTYGWIHRCQNDTFSDVENGTGVEYTNYNCTNNATVTLLLLNESGHIPFQNGYETSKDASTTQMDTTEMAYQFCLNHSKDEIPESLLNRRSSSATLKSQLTVISLLSFLLISLFW